jgi:hypothetical protein
MFFSAALNLALALTLPAQKVAELMAIWSPASKVVLLALHIATFKVIGRRTARMRAQAAQVDAQAQGPAPAAA